MKSCFQFINNLQFCYGKKPQQFIFNQIKSEKSDFPSLNLC